MLDSFPRSSVTVQPGRCSPAQPCALAGGKEGGTDVGSGEVKVRGPVLFLGRKMFPQELPQPQSFPVGTALNCCPFYFIRMKWDVLVILAEGPASANHGCWNMILCASTASIQTSICWMCDVPGSSTAEGRATALPRTKPISARWLSASPHLP